MFFRSLFGSSVLALPPCPPQRMQGKWPEGGPGSGGGFEAPPNNFGCKGQFGESGGGKDLGGKGSKTPGGWPGAPPNNNSVGNGPFGKVAKDSRAKTENAVSSRDPWGKGGKGKAPELAPPPSTSSSSDSDSSDEAPAVGGRNTGGGSKTTMEVLKELQATGYTETGDEMQPLGCHHQGRGQHRVRSGVAEGRETISTAAVLRWVGHGRLCFL